jgi:hypothetical protein
MNWTFAGAFGYLILFQASTWFTELLSARKYPDYKIYQERVGKFFPKMATKSMDDQSTVDSKMEGRKPESMDIKGSAKGKGKAATKRR